ncbi:MAG TPA: hypothetical protein VFV34_25965 [Blastocatellia bacterium]|nr:hypothetical protein [Blastocatellia bacterium]
MTTGAGKSATSRDAILAVLKTLPPPAEDGCVIPVPRVVDGSPQKPYREDPQAGADAIGLSFDFEAVPGKSRYYALKPKIIDIAIPGLTPGWTDDQCYYFISNLVSKTRNHEQVHIRVALRVALAVQQTPEFQALGSAGLVEEARAVEGYVNSLADVRTDHGHARIWEKIWEGSGERQIERAISKAIKFRLKDATRFKNRLKELIRLSGRQLESEDQGNLDEWRDDILEEGDENR